MSHNLHYVLVADTNKEEVEYNSELQRLNGWGTEDNYWYIEEVIDINDDNDQDKLQEVLNRLNETFSSERIAKVKEDIKTYTEKANDGDRHYYWLLQESYKLLYELTPHANEVVTKDNIADTDDYFGYEFDNFGITNTIYDELEEGEKVFVVVVNMHS